ncbi:T9SS type A sorting domain-containing protein [candidate division WOR-3 bacterium]|nr:T9SS type A sorting domain-containing protein [candidate division WOR-3 bacterium]
MGYFLKAPDLPSTMQLPYVNLDVVNYEDDTLWHLLERDVYNDINEYEKYPIPMDATLDSIILWGVSKSSPLGYWRGQKIYFDDVRLMGYADYDVGVKEITSVTETIPCTPSALIKNFGREPAEFSVVAEILQGETILYADTLPWFLPSDTEDTVSFSTFTPPDTGAYLLRIYTVMDAPPAIDESDADDEKTMELHFEAITEPPVTHPELLTFEVKPSMSAPLQVSYSLPKGYTVALTLFDLSGRREDAKQVRGYGSATFSPEVAAGVYIVRLEASGTTLSRKVVVVE